MKRVQDADDECICRRGGKDNRFQPVRHGTQSAAPRNAGTRAHRAKIDGNDNNSRRESHPKMRTEISPRCPQLAGTTCRAVLAGALLAVLGLTGSGLAAQTEALAPVQAQSDDTDAQALRSIDQEVQDIKAEVLALNRDLFILEEELLFPANTQVAVFVSLDVGDFFALDSVELQLDGKQVASYLYTERELEALKRGGVQRLFLGNLRTGEHELVAFFTGKGTHERDYRRGTTLNFEKTLGTKYLELRIEDRERRLQPEFVVKQWD